MSQRKIKQLKVLKNTVLVEEQIGVDSFYNYFGIWKLIKTNWKFLLFLCLGISLLFFNSLNGAFVSDDYATIPQFPQLNDFWFMLNKDSFGNSMYLSNYFINSLFGSSNPIPYHVFSLICFLIVLILGYVFILVIFRNETLAKVSIILFSVMPIHVESVSWISGRLYILLAIFILSSMLNFIYYLNSGKNNYLLWSFLFFVFAFQTDKPRPFAIFFIIFIYLLLIGWNKFKTYFIKIWWLIPLVVVVFALLSLSYTNIRINVVNSGINGSGGIFYNPFFQYPTSIAKYLQLLWFPVDLTLYHTMYFMPDWLNWSILISYLSLLIYFYFKNRYYFFALAFIFAAAAPSMAPVKVSWLVAERYMFLGSLGFSMFIGLVILDLNKYFKLIPGVLFISLILFGAVRIYLRNIDWQTNHNLWVNTCQVSPNSHNAWNNIGDDYDKLKQYENAIKGFTQSTIVKPNYADAYHNRANIFYKVSRFDLARESYTSALKFNPNLYQTYMSLVQIDLMEKKYDVAVSDASKLLEFDKSNPQFNYVLAVVYAQAGNVNKAKDLLKSILATTPNFYQAQKALTDIEKLSPANK